MGLGYFSCGLFNINDIIDMFLTTYFTTSLHGGSEQKKADHVTDCSRLCTTLCFVQDTHRFIIYYELYHHYFVH